MQESTRRGYRPRLDQYLLPDLAAAIRAIMAKRWARNWRTSGAYAAVGRLARLDAACALRGLTRVEGNDHDAEECRASTDGEDEARWERCNDAGEECQVNIDRQEIVDQLRGRNEDEVADLAERELPEVVDTEEHADLLHQLGINPTDLLGGIGGTFG